MTNYNTQIQPTVAKIPTESTTMVPVYDDLQWFNGPAWAVPGSSATFTPRTQSQTRNVCTARA